MRSIRVRSVLRASSAFEVTGTTGDLALAFPQAPSIQRRAFLRAFATLSAAAATGALSLHADSARAQNAAPGAVPTAVPHSVSNSVATFPRLMGMNIGAKNYDDPAYQRDLAKLDIVMLGFFRGWLPNGYAPDPTAAIRKAVQSIKALNPKLRIGQYTVLNETYDDAGDASTSDLRDKVSAAGWWLGGGGQKRVQWTKQYSTFEVNFTRWAPPDNAGKRWPQWLAARNYDVYFRDIPEFDIVYLDNVMGAPRVRGDWDLDGTLDDPASAKIIAAYRAGHAEFWNEIRRLQPRALLVGNADNDLSDPAWRGQLDGAFLEGLMGENWSLETTAGWPTMMARYHAAIANTRGPKIVGFNVTGNPGDLRFFRYAYASCLLDDGYFSFTDPARGHSSVPWFDEYDAKLGRALDAPPAAAWSQGVWGRRFENGMVLVNPTRMPRTVTVETGYRHLAGAQDARINDGSAARAITLAAQDGVVLRK